MKKKVIIVGAGPAGLSAAYLLSKHSNFSIKIFEADPEYVGGISKTYRYKDYLFDIGGHRFFSYSEEINNLWDELLPDDFIINQRSSKIYYNNSFFEYPLNPFGALFKLGLLNSTLCVSSYLKSRLMPIRPVDSFEDWITNEFGDRLYRIFFKTYTEKVWGIDCKKISADWAAQRIDNLSLSSAILNSIKKLYSETSSKQIKTLINSFKYPKRGPGLLWEQALDKIVNKGGEIRLGAKVNKIHRNNSKFEIFCDNGVEETGDIVISSMPIGNLVKCLSSDKTTSVLNAASALKYRHFLIVVLIIRNPMLFKDQWIYIHDPHVKVGRIQNFRAWSPDLIPNETHCSYGLEYFCSEQDGLWDMTDTDLIKLAESEFKTIGLMQGVSDIEDACVVRQKKAYPIYDHGYRQNIDTLRNYLSPIDNLHTIGRNGMHHYNSMDHAMMSGILTAKNIIADSKIHDPWSIDLSGSSHKNKINKSKTERLVPHIK